MKSIAIFRHARTEGPGYLADFLDVRNIPWRLIRIDAGDPLPESPRDFSGLVFMGGPMSVNDDLPWIPRVLDLIRAAVAVDIPVLGHCLGGQLMAKALGGMVSRNPVKEIGWGEVRVADHDEARYWFGETRNFTAFHWHGETFSLPPGAVHVLSSTHCQNQAFVVGRHLALQCHVEMTEAMVREWCAVGAEEIQCSLQSPGVQSPEEILAPVAEEVPRLNQVAEQIYTRWVRGLSGMMAQ